ncbi:DUF4287 domain-containing protein [soil metagenome]
MSEPAVSALTERQKKWFASVRASLETRTGKSLAEWTEIAKTAPEGTTRQKMNWFKAEHGLLQNSAGFVLSQLNGGKDWEDNVDTARDTLWADPNQRAIFEAVEAKALALPGVVRGQRKAYTAFSREFQFVSLKPVKKGGVRVGLALEPDADSRLTPPKNEGWSERLHAVLELPDVGAVDGGVDRLLKAAWERS